MKLQNEKHASVLKNLTQSIEVNHSEGSYLFLFNSLRDIPSILSSVPTGYERLTNEGGRGMTETIGITQPGASTTPSFVSMVHFFSFLLYKQ